MLVNAFSVIKYIVEYANLKSNDCIYIMLHGLITGLQHAVVVIKYNYSTLG